MGEMDGCLLYVLTLMNIPICKKLFLHYKDIKNGPIITKKNIVSEDRCFKGPVCKI